MIVHTRLSLVIEVVLDTQLRPMCKSTNDTVPLVMDMVMLFRLTLIRLKSLANRTDPQLRCNEHVVICSLKQWNPSTWGDCMIRVVDRQLRFYQTLFHKWAVIKVEFGLVVKQATWRGLPRWDLPLHNGEIFYGPSRVIWFGSMAMRDLVKC